MREVKAFKSLTFSVKVKDSKKMKSKKRKKWVQNVITDSTSPPGGIFTKDAKTIARVMAKPEVSPRGIGSAIRMVQYFINRSGKGLSKERKKELEKSKKLLQKMLVN